MATETFAASMTAAAKPREMSMRLFNMGFQCEADDSWRHGSDSFYTLKAHEAEVHPVRPLPLPHAEIDCLKDHTFSSGMSSVISQALPCSIGEHDGQTGVW